MMREDWKTLLRARHASLQDPKRRKVFLKDLKLAYPRLVNYMATRSLVCFPTLADIDFRCFVDPCGNIQPLSRNEDLPSAS